MMKFTLSAAALLLGASVAAAGGQPIVIDPVTGVEMPISEIGMGSLTPEQRADVQAQLQALAATREGEEHQHRHEHQHQHENGGAGGTGGGQTGGGAAPGRS